MTTIYNFPSADHAEQAGAQVATDCLTAMNKASTQAESLQALTAALSALEHLPHRHQASRGFAAALVNVIEIGLEHLAKGGNL